MASSRYIVIVGCGRLGSILANQLSAQGHRIVVVDRDERSFERLSHEFSGFRIVGDVTQQHILNEAKIAQADYVFATTTLDNVNLMVAQVAKTIYGVQNVVARIYSTSREVIFRELGITTISPTHLTADAFMAFFEEHDKEGINL